MPGGNFDNVLAVDGNGHVLPQGPLQVGQDETMDRLSAWVFQVNPDGSGAACIASQQGTFSNTQWTTDPNTAVHRGQFQPGPAVGSAMAISRVKATGATRVHWWSETISVQ